MNHPNSILSRLREILVRNGLVYMDTLLSENRPLIQVGKDVFLLALDTE